MFGFCFFCSCIALLSIVEVNVYALHACLPLVQDGSIRIPLAGAGEVGARTLKMWATDQILDQDAIPVGFHLFKCPLLAVGAEVSWRTWVKMDELSEEMKDVTRKKMTIGTHGRVLHSEFAYCGLGSDSSF